MSLFHPVNLVCPACGEVLKMPAVGSVNADRRPDLRDDILGDRFQDVSCASCEASFRLQPEFNYLHVKMGQWIAALPAVRMPDYLEIEDEVLDLFGAAYGDRAPPIAREIGRDLTVRLTFGWPAVREKILLRERGLDDVAIEILKLEMLRAMAEAPLGPDVELRFVEDMGGELGFAWLSGRAESSAGDALLVDRAAYDRIAAQPETYAELRAELTSGPFVDMQKLTMGPGRGAPPPPEPDVDAILAEPAA